jgi:hypothetical protein
MTEKNGHLVERARIYCYFSFMFLRIFSICLLLACCTSKPSSGLNGEGGSDSSSASDTHDSKQAETRRLHTRLLGNWGNESSANAVFAIGRDSINYVDAFSSSRYTLENDTMTIYFPDYVSKFKISFTGDTLIMFSDESGPSKFWKFNN